MKKIMMYFKENVVLKCIEMQDLHVIFLNSSIFLNYFL
jgi:hypothetical protein